MGRGCDTRKCGSLFYYLFFLSQFPSSVVTRKKTLPPLLALLRRQNGCCCLLGMLHCWCYRWWFSPVSFSVCLSNYQVEESDKQLRRAVFSLSICLPHWWSLLCRVTISHNVAHLRSLMAITTTGNDRSCTPSLSAHLFLKKKEQQCRVFSRLIDRLNLNCWSRLACLPKICGHRCGALFMLSFPICMMSNLGHFVGRESMKCLH